MSCYWVAPPRPGTAFEQRRYGLERKNSDNNGKNPCRNERFVYIRPGTTLAYLLTNLGLGARMIVDDQNRTIRRIRDNLASINLEPSDTLAWCTSSGMSDMGGACVIAGPSLAALPATFLSSEEIVSFSPGSQRGRTGGRRIPDRHQVAKLQSRRRQFPGC